MINLNKYERTKRLWIVKHKSSSYSSSENIVKNNVISDKFIHRHLDVLQDAESLIELGIGSGRNINIFLKYLPNIKYFGNDISPNVNDYVFANYPNVAEKCEIFVQDTKDFLNHAPNVDVTFTHGHLMHFPDTVIGEICANICNITNQHILIREAFTNDRGAGFFRNLKYRRYRFDRDYSNLFPGFEMKDQIITKHPSKSWVRQGEYLFSRK